MRQHFQFNWETIGYKGHTAIGEIKRWDCFNDSPARKVRPTVNWVSMHSDLTMTVRCELFIVIIFCVKSHPSWIYMLASAGCSVSISISQINSFVFQTVMVQELHLFLLGLGQHIMYFFAQQPRPVISNTLALWACATSQAASCTSAAVINVLQFSGLYCTAVECRLWLGVAVCTPPHAHPSHCRSVCLC